MLVMMNSIIGKYGMGVRRQWRAPSSSCRTTWTPFATNIYFRLRKKHLDTWISSDNQRSNQINYILVSRRWKNSLLNSHSHRSTETGNLHGPDHVTESWASRDDRMWCYSREDQSIHKGILSVYIGVCMGNCQTLSKWELVFIKAASSRPQYSNVI